MYSKGKLNSIQELWFKTPKSEIEFYDLQSDPYEINNLMQTPQKNSYKSLVKKYKRQLEKWIEKTNDLGRISEKEIIENSSR